jgi:hypothetical protein
MSECRDCGDKPEPATRKVLGLLVYYDGGTVYRVETPEEWAAMPDFGIIEAVVYFDDGRRNTLGGHNFYLHYLHEDGPVWMSMTADSEEAVKAMYPNATVKRGKWVPEITMRRVVDQAMAEKW